MHLKENEEPEVMVPGVSFTIEPILKVGSTDFKIWNDKWTVEVFFYF
jgi:hypothetical protein